MGKGVADTSDHKVLKRSSSLDKRRAVLRCVEVSLCNKAGGQLQDCRKSQNTSGIQDSLTQIEERQLLTKKW